MQRAQGLPGGVQRLVDWRTIGSVVLAVLLLAFLFRVLLRIDLGETWELIAGANPVLFIGAFAAYYATFPLRAMRWRYILGRAGIAVSRRDATEIFCLSWFVNCVAPARLGDVYRVHLLTEHNDADASRTVGTLFIERVADIIGVFAVAVVAGMLSFRGRIGPELATLFVVGLALAVGLAVLALGLRFGGSAITRRLPGRAAKLWERFRHGSSAAMSPRSVAAIGLTTAAIWSMEGLRLYLVVRALDLPEIGIGFMAAVFVAQISALFSIIPLTPAGTGFVEAGLIYALRLYGVPTGAGTAAAIADRSITLLSVLVFGSLLYVTSRKVRRGLTGRRD